MTRPAGVASIRSSQEIHSFAITKISVAQWLFIRVKHGASKLFQLDGMLPAEVERDACVADLARNTVWESASDLSSEHLNSGKRQAKQHVENVLCGPCLHTTPVQAMMDNAGTTVEDPMSLGWTGTTGIRRW